MFAKMFVQNALHLQQRYHKSFSLLRQQKHFWGVKAISCAVCCTFPLLCDTWMQAFECMLAFARG
jgi:hypothetical protein